MLTPLQKMPKNVGDLGKVPTYETPDQSFLSRT